MLRLNVLPLLRAQGKTKYWLYKQLGMSYQNFNKQLGMSYQNFNRMVNNQTKSIRYEVIETLCQVLECTPNDLFISD